MDDALPTPISTNSTIFTTSRPLMELAPPAAPRRSRRTAAKGACNLLRSEKPVARYYRGHPQSRS